MASSSNARVSQVMDVMKNSLAKRVRDKRAKVARGNITMKRKAKHQGVGMLEGGGMEQLLSLRARGLLLSQLERRERRSSCGWKGRKKGSNYWWGGGRGTRKGISNSIGETRSMLNSNGELRKES